MNVRIVLTGPESTGKSDLTLHLARTFKLPFALEFARIYLEHNGPEYDYELLLELSRGHKKYQRSCLPESMPLGFLDTDLINYKIWCEVVFGRCHDEIVRGIESEAHHVYLLCYPDLPWSYDPLRENRENREMLYDLHLAELERLGRPYHVIKGSGRDRYLAAEAAVRKIVSIRP